MRSVFAHKYVRNTKYKQNSGKKLYYDLVFNQIERKLFEVWNKNESFDINLDQNNTIKQNAVIAAGLYHCFQFPRKQAC